MSDKITAQHLVSSEPLDVEGVPHMVDTYVNGMTVTRPVSEPTPPVVREALGEDAP